MKREAIKAVALVVCICLVVLLLTILQEEWISRFNWLPNSFKVIYGFEGLVTAIIAFNIYFSGMFYYQQSISLRLDIFSSAFLSVGVFGLIKSMISFDIIHLHGKDFENIEPWFWMAEGVIQTFFLLSLVCLSGRKQINREVKQVVIVLSLLVPFILTSILLSGSNYLPVIAGKENLVAFTLAGIHLLIIIKITLLLKKQVTREGLFVMVGALFIMVSFLFSAWSLTEFFFNLELASQLFKLIGYFYLLKAVLNKVGRTPYEKMQDLTQRHSSLLNNVAEGIFGVDHNGLIVFINEPACQMLRFREDELLGRSPHRLIHHTKEDGTDYLIKNCPIQASTIDGYSRTIEGEVFWRKDGSSFPVEYFTRTIVENEKITGTVVTFMDRTERHELEKLQKEQRLIEYEIELAASLQKELLLGRTKLPDFADAGIVSLPYKALNGDFYALSPFENHLTIAIADVCGKGIPAAIQMAMMKFAMETNRPPNQIIAEINRFFAKHMGDSSFITMCIANYDHQNATLTYSSAGHEPAILYKPLSQEFYELTTSDPLLGIQQDVEYRIGNVNIDPGDILLLYTDGIIERRNNKEDTNAILKRILQEMDVIRPAQEIVNELYEKTACHFYGQIEDDQTMIIIKFDNQNQEEEAQL